MDVSALREDFAFISREICIPTTASAGSEPGGFATSCGSLGLISWPAVGENAGGRLGLPLRTKIGDRLVLTGLGICTTASGMTTSLPRRS